MNIKIIVFGVAVLAGSSVFADQPGAVLWTSGTLTTSDSLGTSDDITSFTNSGGVSLVSGRQYWLGVSAVPSAEELAWNYNSTGATGTLEELGFIVPDEPTGAFDLYTTGGLSFTDYGAGFADKDNEGWTVGQYLAYNLEPTCEFTATSSGTITSGDISVGPYSPTSGTTFTVTLYANATAAPSTPSPAALAPFGLGLIAAVRRRRG